MRFRALGLALTALAAPAADPPRTTVVMADHAGTSTRWAASPYPTLLARPWAAELRRRAAQDRGPFQVIDVLAGLPDGARADLSLDDGGQPRAVISGTGAATLAAVIGDRGLPSGADSDAMVLLLGPAFDSGFRLPPGLPGADTLVPRLALLPPLPPPHRSAPPAADRDCEARWTVALGGTGTAAVTATWTVAPFGLRERITIRGLPRSATMGTGADPEAFASLPATTVDAVSLAPMSDLLAALPVDRVLWDARLSAQGLPPVDVLAPRIGRSLLWIEAIGTLPAATLAITMDRPTADLLLGWLDRTQGFVAVDGGTHLGVVGFIPVHAGWVDGRLVLTMHPRGLAAAKTDARPEDGMLKDPEATAARDALPSTPCLVAAIARSGPSWSLATALAPWLARRNPAMAGLAADLRAAGHHGFLSLRQDPTDGHLALDAGGLLGGPLSATVIGGGFLRVKAEAHRAAVAPPSATAGALQDL